MKSLIEASEFGDFLGTRFLGEQMRRKIESCLPEGAVTIDFQGVSGLSQSFADECFGMLLSEHGTNFLNKNLAVQNLNADGLAVLRFVLADRLGKTFPNR